MTKDYKNATLYHSTEFCRVDTRAHVGAWWGKAWRQTLGYFWSEDLMMTSLHYHDGRTSQATYISSLWASATAAPSNGLFQYQSYAHIHIDSGTFFPLSHLPPIFPALSQSSWTHIFLAPTVIFASIIGAVVLREPFGFARARAAMLVAAGIVAMHWLSN